MVNFSDFKLKSEILKIINEVGYKKPTLIQLRCIPLILDGYDLLGIAKTGSGKTASFVLPLLNNIKLNNLLQVLVLAPTRELVIQIRDSFILFSKYIIKLNILSLYGGQKYSVQISFLKKRPNIIIATPGRLIDLFKRKLFNFNNIKFLVIDEADEMLRKGFIDDVIKIISFIKCKHQTVLFSATICNSVRKIIKKFMTFPKEINLSLISDNNKNYLPKNIKQYYCFVSYRNKLNILIKFLESERYRAVLIFVKTKNYTIKLYNILYKYGYNCSALNGDMNQNLRELTINNFRNKKIDILIATDIASRGLDFDNIDLVINYDIPMDIKSYVHRIGRTGRADNKGKTILFIDNIGKKFLFLIKKKLKVNILKKNIPNNKNIFNRRIEKILFKINIFSENINNKFYIKVLNILLNSKIINNNYKKLSFIFLKIIYNFYFKNLSI